MIVYTLLRKENTEELHLFKGHPISTDKCTVYQNSICKKMDKTEKNGSEFGCFDEDEARMECADIGRTVCGTCVSHLYETY